MSKKILFSVPFPEIKEKIKPFIFSQNSKENVFAYMPSDGSDTTYPEYITAWQKYVEDNKATFVLINNSLRGKLADKEKHKLNQANILMITGGNTFKLLKNLRESGLDQSVKHFAQKKDNIIVGFSAGAIVLSPSIKTATMEDNDEVHLDDLTGLNILPFLVVPHADTKQAYIRELLQNGEDICVINNDEFRVL